MSAPAFATPGSTPGPDQCQGCLAFVSPGERRVWGGNDGRMYACQNCVTHAELKHGAAAIEDYQPGDLKYRIGGQSR
jgi:hypothetical protein